jgi:DNA-binding FrmR family transcriptional regulator
LTLLKVFRGLGEELGPAAGRAEVKGPAGVVRVVRRRRGIHLHAADRIDDLRRIRSMTAAGVMLVVGRLGHGLVLESAHIPHGGILQLPAGGIGSGSPDRSAPMDPKPKLLNRLNRIEGQVRGVARMVGEDRYCIDILTQLQAARAALARVEGELLKQHLNHCIESAIVSGDKEAQREKAAELVQLLERGSR